MPSDELYPDLATLAAVIAHSQIIVATLSVRLRLPAGYDATDVAILEWIASEGRRAGRAFPRI